MEDLGKDIGLEYAKLLPVAIAGCIGILILIAWALTKTGDLEENWRGPVRFGLVVAAVVVIVQLPAAYGRAKDYCREQWAQAGGASSSDIVPIDYSETKCMIAWPHGPD